MCVCRRDSIERNFRHIRKRVCKVTEDGMRGNTGVRLVLIIREEVRKCQKIRMCVTLTIGEKYPANE